MSLSRFIEVVDYAMQAALVDVKETGSEYSPIQEYETFVRIYTRESRNPQMSRNGGDYSFWVDIYPDGRVENDTSCDISWDWNFDDLGASEEVERFFKQEVIDTRDPRKANQYGDFDKFTDEQLLKLCFQTWMTVRWADTVGGIEWSNPAKGVK